MEKQPYSLLDLYKLLWEQIKDMTRLNAGLCYEVSDLRWIGKISNEEASILKDSILINMPILILLDGSTSCFGWHATPKGTQQRKEFVQLMIKELEGNP